MPDPIKTEEIKPITITMVGGTGDGGAPIPSGTVLTTPDHQPNVIVNAITPLVAITVRFLNAYLTSLLGLLSVGLPTGLISATDFTHVLLKYAGYALAGPALGLIKNFITILSNLEKKYPLLTGNV